MIVRVICCLDGTPFVYPDGMIHVVVPGADVYVTEHEGQCVVREMALLTSEAAGAHAELWADVQRAGERAGCMRESAYATVADMADELIEARSNGRYA
jgi:hypothetical protein